MNEIKEVCKNIAMILVIWLIVYLGYGEPDIMICRGLFNIWLVALIAALGMLQLIRLAVIKGLATKASPKVTTKFIKQVHPLSWRSIMGYVSMVFVSYMLFSTDHTKTGLVYMSLSVGIMVSSYLTKQTILKFAQE